MIGVLVGGRVLAGLLALTAPAVPAAAPADQLPTILPVSLGVEPRERDDTHELPPDTAEQLRKDALARALVWLEPEPAEELDLRDNPRDLFDGRAEVACKFHPDKTSGSTPKFECVFAGGEVLKVKYGSNPEIHTEVAAARLLRALGAGADTMYLMRRVRCFGCPKDPEVMLRCISSPFDDVRRQCAAVYGETTAAGVLQIKVDYASSTTGTTGRTTNGWSASRTGRARRTAAATVLLPTCTTSGRPSVVWERPRRSASWTSRAGGRRRSGRTPTCLVKIESPPMHGATFGEASISEAGRAYLARRLRRLRTSDVRDLFEGARFAEYAEASGPSRDVGQWVGAFEEKVRQITERAPCPTP